MVALRHLTAAFLTLTIDSADSLSDTSTASYLYTEPTTNAVAISLSTSIATSFESTATVFTTSTKPQDTVISTTLGTTIDLTTEGSQGTTEATSIAKTTTEETTSTAFKIATGTTSEVPTTSPRTTITATATAESTSEPATSSIETTTTTAAAPVSTTFNLLMQGGRPDGVVLHSDGQFLQLRTSEYPDPYPATYPEAALSYDQDTQHLLIGEKPLCIYYDTVGTVASISACRGIPTGQYAYLTCDPPSNSALTCNVPGKRYDQTSASLVDLGLTWNQFYYLEGAKQMPGLGWILIGRADLTSNDIEYNNFDPINIITRIV
ncbi:uncharacterized protein QYS62_006803 [Fusarium acuminatum]|uniref:Uncharacterized protein n=1 Tax=Fusarium acuminatum TaxID=5515 RepID=A0ABZ2WZU8_9HYPO